MLLRTKLETGGALLAFVLIALLVASAREARKDAEAMKAALASQTKIVASATKDEEVRDKAVEKTVTALEDARKRVQTPREALKELPTAIPLPLPLIPVPIQQESQGSGQKELPESPGAVVPAGDLKPLYDFGIACQECQAKLDAATKDRADDAVKLAAITKERDAAVAAAKGGKLWTRVKRNAKWLLLGLGAGAVGGAVAARR